jgi:hypothetical protein
MKSRSIGNLPGNVSDFTDLVVSLRIFFKKKASPVIQGSFFRKTIENTFIE